MRETGAIIRLGFFVAITVGCSAGCVISGPIATTSFPVRHDAVKWVYGGGSRCICGTLWTGMPFIGPTGNELKNLRLVSSATLLLDEVPYVPGKTPMLGDGARLVALDLVSGKPSHPSDADMEGATALSSSPGWPTALVFQGCTLYYGDGELGVSFPAGEGREKAIRLLRDGKTHMSVAEAYEISSNYLIVVLNGVQDHFRSIVCIDLSAIRAAASETVGVTTHASPLDVEKGNSK